MKRLIKMLAALWFLLFTSAALAGSFDVSPLRFAAQLKDAAEQFVNNPDFQPLECGYKSSGTGPNYVITYGCGVKAAGVLVISFGTDRPPKTSEIHLTTLAEETSRIALTLSLLMTLYDPLFPTTRSEKDKIFAFANDPKVQMFLAETSRQGGKTTTMQGKEAVYLGQITNSNEHDWIEIRVLPRK
jgi:hypothetical protein